MIDQVLLKVKLHMTLKETQSGSWDGRWRLFWNTDPRLTVFSSDQLFLL